MQIWTQPILEIFLAWDARRTDPKRGQNSLRTALRIGVVAGSITEAALAAKALLDWNLGWGLTLWLFFVVTCSLARDHLEEILRATIDFVRWSIQRLDVIVMLLSLAADKIHQLFADRPLEITSDKDDPINSRTLVSGPSRFLSSQLVVFSFLAAIFTATLLASLSFPSIHNPPSDKKLVWNPFEGRWQDPWDGEGTGGGSDLDPQSALVSLGLVAPDPTLPFRHPEWRHGYEGLTSFTTYKFHF